MQVNNEVNWSVSDFVIAGILLLSTGLSYELITRKTSITSYKVAAGMAVGTALILVWINLAVGLIGSEENPVNLLYIGVLAVGIVGYLIARFRSHGMSRALFATAFTQILVTVIALIFWRSAFNESPGLVGIFTLNALFAALFIASALLFRRARGKDLHKQELDIQTQ
jgi:hypothetical protein